MCNNRLKKEVKKLKKITLKMFASTLLAFALTIFVAGSLKTSASTLDLTNAQKLDLYNQYLEIVAEINGGSPNATLELLPFESFKDEDFIEPSEFEEYAIERSNVKFDVVTEAANPEGEISPMSTVYNTTSAKVTSNGSDVTLTINGSFITNYSTVNLRQLFGGINYINVSPNKGSWTKATSTGYSAKLADGGRTYFVTVSGTVTINTLKSNHNIELEYFCNTDGSVGAR